MSYKFHFFDVAISCALDVDMLASHGMRWSLVYDEAVRLVYKRASRALEHGPKVYW